MARSLEQALASLSAMSPTELRRQWLQLYKTPAPPLTADLLARGVAWRMQEKVAGGFAPATLRLVARLAKQLDRDGTLGPAQRIKPGTRIVRDWHGAVHHVLVLEDGYLYQERRYRSLSQIARDITGVHWSGPRFFGVGKAA